MIRIFLPILLLFALVMPCAAQDEDISMDGLTVGNDAVQTDDAPAVDLTMEGHSNKSLDELDAAERQALLDAIVALREALEALEKRCAASCEAENPGSDVLVHEEDWRRIFNGWRLAPELRASLITPTQAIYSVTDVGDLYWRINDLCKKIKGDMGQASDENRVKALVKVRYKLVPQALESLAKAKRNLHARGALPSPYDVLPTKNARELLRTMFELHRGLKDYAALVRKAVADESVEAVTHKRPLIGANLWTVAEPHGTAFREACQQLWAMHTFMDKEVRRLAPAHHRPRPRGRPRLEAHDRLGQGEPGQAHARSPEAPRRDPSRGDEGPRRRVPRPRRRAESERHPPLRPEGAIPERSGHGRSFFHGGFPCIVRVGRGIMPAGRPSYRVPSGEGRGAR